MGKVGLIGSANLKRKKERRKKEETCDCVVNVVGGQRSQHYHHLQMNLCNLWIKMALPLSTICVNPCNLWFIKALPLSIQKNLPYLFIFKINFCFFCVSCGKKTSLRFMRLTCHSPVCLDSYPRKGYNLPSFHFRGRSNNTKKITEKI